MDDLAGKLNELLNDPQAMQQVSALAGMLGNQNGGQQNAVPPVQPPPQENSTGLGALNGLGNLGNLGALSSLLGNQPSSGAPEQTNGLQNQMNGDMMQMMLKMMPLLNSFQQEDNSTRLLQSLRPLLSRERQQKLDEAARMMKMFRLLPLLQSQGML